MTRQEMATSDRLTAMGSVLIGSVSSSAAALRGMRRGGLPLTGVCGLAREHAAGVSDYVDLEPLAREAGVPFVGFRKVTDPAVVEFLRDHPADWLFIVGLSQLLPASLRAMPRLGAVGFHPTLLPEGRGRAPVAWTILLDRPAAANLFYLTDEPDAGDLIEQRPVPVLPDDYACDLIARTNQVLEDMMADLAPAFAAGRVPHRPQDSARATYYPRRRPEDGLIDWAQPVDAVYRLIRAVSRPYPGAFTYYQQRRLVIWRAQPCPPQPAGTSGMADEKRSGLSFPSQEPDMPPGLIVELRDGLPVVQTASGRLQVTDMEWSDGVAVPLQAGERLG